jgi:DNA-binding NarL/FixJ family response regulator
MITQAITTIWILEDHEVFAKQIRRLIGAEEDMACPHHFTSAADFYDKLKFTNERPDLLLLDLGLPRRDGLEVLSDIRRILPEVKVLILTSFDDRDKVYRAICNGASGYLLKTADPDEILNGIRDVVHGASALSSPIAKMILEGFRATARSNTSSRSPPARRMSCAIW